MSLLRAALRLLFGGAVLLLGGVAVSVMTRDAWLIVGHVASVLSAVITALAVLLLVAAGIRRLASPPCSDAAKRDDQRGMDGVSIPVERSVRGGGGGT